MSIEALNWALGHMQREELTTNVRFVLMILANRADPEGVCWPSVRYIMARTGLGERTVREACKAISELGLMQVERQQRTDGGKATNKYNLCISAPPPAPAAPTPPAVAAPTQVHGVQVVGAPPAPHETKEETPLPDGKGTRARKFPIPEGFKASGAVIDWALSRGLTRDYVEQQLEAFSDDARSNRRLHADWDAALRTWIRRQPQFDRNAPRPVKGMQAPAQIDRRCVWPKSDSPLRCSVTSEQDKEGSWIGRGVFLCGEHLKAHLDREDAKRHERGLPHREANAA